MNSVIAWRLIPTRCFPPQVLPLRSLSAPSPKISNTTAWGNAAGLGAGDGHEAHRETTLIKEYWLTFTDAATVRKDHSVP